MFINVVIIINMFHSTPSLIIKPSASWQSKLLGHLCHHQQKIFIINIVGFYQNNSFSAVSTDTLIPHPCLFMNITSTRVPVTHLNTSFPLWLRTVSGTHPPPPPCFYATSPPLPPPFLGLTGVSSYYGNVTVVGPNGLTRASKYSAGVPPEKIQGGGLKGGGTKCKIPANFQSRREMFQQVNQVMPSLPPPPVLLPPFGRP